MGKIRTAHHYWALYVSTCLFLSTVSSAITISSIKSIKGSKSLEDPTKSVSGNKPASISSSKISPRHGLHDDDNDNLRFLESSLISTELVKRSQNISASESKSHKEDVKEKAKQDSPSNIDVIGVAELGDENRFSKADKNPRIYYGDTAPSYPHEQGGESDFDNGVPEGKFELNEKPKGKIYFPKHYMSSKFMEGQKHGHKQNIGSSGKRVPDHFEFDEEHRHGHEYPAGHNQQQQHPSHEHHGHEEHEYGNDEHHYGSSEEHNGKEHHQSPHHISGYGYNQHHGSFRHTISGKVDAVGKALKVLLPSALLLTGVSALFPNRVHVPVAIDLNNNNLNHRQKRAVMYRRRSSIRRESTPPQMPEELEDIPTHVLRAEHRIMEGSPGEIYPEEQRITALSSSENRGFNPFRVFKGPGSSETAVRTMQDSIRMPIFPDIPDMSTIHDENNQFLQQFPGGGPENSGEFQPTPYGPESDEVPPTLLSPEGPTTPYTHGPPSSSEYGIDAPPQGFGDRLNKHDSVKKRNPLRRRKNNTRKPAVFLKGKKVVQDSSESQKTPYLVRTAPEMKNYIEDAGPNKKAEQEFMSSLHNLVTPDVAKAIIENKQEPPKDVDMSPDGPVMGLLNSFSQHEHESPHCQKRALCDLAVRGKGHNSTKFEAFLWSVATLVPDVFSEMYDLQEVFQAIRDERCVRFECKNPNLDLQMK